MASKTLIRNEPEPQAGSRTLIDDIRWIVRNASLYRPSLIARARHGMHANLSSFIENLERARIRKLYLPY